MRFEAESRRLFRRPERREESLLVGILLLVSTEDPTPAPVKVPKPVMPFDAPEQDATLEVALRFVGLD